MSDSSDILSCRSEFLQEFAGQLLRRFGQHYGFLAEVDIYEDEGQSLERISVWITTVYSIEIRLNLWEDKVIWVGVALLPANRDSFEIGFYPDFALLGIERVVEALDETVSISTRICYDESPEPLLRQIWSFNGEMDIEGVL